MKTNDSRLHIFVSSHFLQFAGQNIRFLPSYFEGFKGT